MLIPLCCQSIQCKKALILYTTGNSRKRKILAGYKSWIYYMGYEILYQVLLWKVWEKEDNEYNASCCQGHYNRNCSNFNLVARSVTFMYLKQFRRFCPFIFACNTLKFTHILSHKFLIKTVIVLLFIFKQFRKFNILENLIKFKLVFIIQNKHYSILMLHF